MRIFVDENIPSRTVQALRAMGHAVTDFRGTSEEGITDDVLWRRVQEERVMLVTTDKGFVRHWDEPHFGIVVVRLRQPNRLRIHERVLEALRRFPEGDWAGLLVVMRDRVQSVRRTPASED